MSVVEAFATQQRWCDQLESPLYAQILAASVEDLRLGGVLQDVVGDWSGDAEADALALRLLGAVHRIVLRGDAPELAKHYPSMGGSPGPDTPDHFLATVHEHQAEVKSGLQLPPQTNEVRRSAALLGGYLRIASHFERPLAILELGSSAGLNLLWDRFHYTLGTRTWGDDDAKVRLTAEWEGPPLPAGSTPAVVYRAGCDLEPLDPASPETRSILESFVWPDQVERLTNLRAALDLAASAELNVRPSSAPQWLPQQLWQLPTDIVPVVMHSIMWTYLSQKQQEFLRHTLQETGHRRPLAWLRLEQAGDEFTVDLTTWPSGETTTLATAHPHGAWVSWRDDA